MTKEQINKRTKEIKAIFDNAMTLAKLDEQNESGIEYAVAYNNDENGVPEVAMFEMNVLGQGFQEIFEVNIKGMLERFEADKNGTKKNIHQLITVKLFNQIESLTSDVLAGILAELTSATHNLAHEDFGSKEEAHAAFDSNFIKENMHRVFTTAEGDKIDAEKFAELTSPEFLEGTMNALQSAIDEKDKGMEMLNGMIGEIQDVLSTKKGKKNILNQIKKFSKGKNLN